MLDSLAAEADQEGLTGSGGRFRDLAETLRGRQLGRVREVVRSILSATDATGKKRSTARVYQLWRRAAYATRQLPGGLRSRPM